MKKFVASFASVLCIATFLVLQLQAQRIDEREVRDILRQLTVKLDDLKYNIDLEVRQRNITRSSRERLLQAFNSLQFQTLDFQDKFSKRHDSQYHVSDVLIRAKVFDEELMNVRLGFTVQRDWESTKTLYNRLAAAYGISWDWQSGSSRTNVGVGTSFRINLNGSYSLDRSRSDDVRLIAERAVRNSDVQNKTAAARDIEILLEPPQNLVIEIQGGRVTLESTLAPRITLTADGRERTEVLSDGRMLKVRATLRGQQELTISSFGEDNDYRVTFLMVDGGRGLRVTRSATLYYLNQTVSAESFYYKTDSVARFGVYEGRDDVAWSDNRDRSERKFIVPNGTIITGTLENEISTKTSKNYDRFTLTVVAPTQFRGAIIEGYVSNISRSGRISGKPQMVFNFETIRMPNGEVYDFRGVLMSVTDAEGKTLKTDPEGTARGDDQSKEAVKRGAIGSALGAIIGAVAGGAKGAAIGAVIGGSVGAGSVVVQGRDDLELRTGSTLMIKSSAPSPR